jgi:hypothetical protein
MSKSIHTTRRQYRKARDADFGGKKEKESVLAAMRDELQQKRELKRDARGKRVGRQVVVARQAKPRPPRVEEELRPAKQLPLVAIEEFSRKRKNA